MPGPWPSLVASGQGAPGLANWRTRLGPPPPPPRDPLSYPPLPPKQSNKAGKPQQHALHACAARGSSRDAQQDAAALCRGSDKTSSFPTAVTRPALSRPPVRAVGTERVHSAHRCQPQRVRASGLRSHQLQVTGLQHLRLGDDGVNEPVLDRFLPSSRGKGGGRTTHARGLEGGMRGARGAGCAGRGGTQRVNAACKVR